MSPGVTLEKRERVAICNDPANDQMLQAIKTSIVLLFVFFLFPRY